MDSPGGKRKLVLLCCVLAVVTVAAYWPVTHHDFIRYDDPVYITDNPRVTSGLTFDNVLWAFRSGYASNWHPLTWISHMVDVELFKLNPGGHHLTSVVLHAANAALLFALLAALTGAEIRSFAVAGLFALHPLHVESVAWVAERKDVLSMLFLLLTITFYARYVRTQPGNAECVSRRKRFYAIALVCFACGLMSKPMLVTTPFLLALLDVWPLGRYEAISFLTPGFARKSLPDKIPFLFLAAASSWITYTVQEKGHAVSLVLPLESRITNAIASYLKYLWKTIYPADLVVFYPHPDSLYPISQQWPLWAIGVAAVVLLVVSAAAVLRVQQLPWFASGWFWYLGSLVPVIGLVQVGSQGLADRYTYIPLVGIFVIAVWGAAQLPVLRSLRRAAVLGVAVTLAACLFLTRQQLSYWQNSLTLFTHAVTVMPANPVANAHLGIEYGQRGEFDKALEHFQAAIRAAPSMPDPYVGLGRTFELQGRVPEAISHYQHALKLRPWDDWTHYRLGLALMQLGRAEDGLEHLRTAVSLRPDFVEGRVGLGAAYSAMGRLAEAEVQLQRALRVAPSQPEALSHLAEVYVKEGALPQAEKRYRQLVRLYPADANNRINLGAVLWMRGQRKEAMEEYARAVEIDASHPVARFNLGTALLEGGRAPQAQAQFEAALRVRPEYPQALSGMARALEAQGKTNEAHQYSERAHQIRSQAAEPK